MNAISLAVAHLLVPGQAEVVRGEAGDHVVVAVAVDVVGVHLRAAGRANLRLVKRPRRAVERSRRLLEPAVLDQDVAPAVAVDVADAQPVAERLRRVLLRDGVKLPGFERLRPVDRGVAEVAVVRADQLGPLVAHDVQELRRLVRHRVEHLVLGPVLVVACRRRGFRRRRPACRENRR